MVDIIFGNNGILDKFIGDQLMAVFGLISPDSSAPHDAIKAAIEMQDATKQLMKVRAEQDKETFEIGKQIDCCQFPIYRLTILFLIHNMDQYESGGES